MIVVFRPIASDIMPAGRAPKIAPIGKIEASQADRILSLIMCTGPGPFSSSMNLSAGEVQATAVPTQNAPRQAVNGGYCGVIRERGGFVCAI